MKTIKKILTAIAIIGILFVPFQTIASTLPVAPAIFETSLSFPLAVTDTSMTLVSTGLIGGQTLPAGYSCFTVDQGQPNTEYICGLVSGTSVTNLVRGVDPLTGNTSDTNLTFSHRRGADVKITDFPVLTLIRNILNGSDTLPGPISYAPGVSPVGNQDLTTKAYVLSVVNGGPITYNQVIVNGTAGATIATGNLVYLNVADGKWYPTSASTSTTVNQVQLAIAQGAGTTGAAITNGVLIKGVDTHNTGTAGAYAYASNTSGVIAGTAGTNSKVVGQYIIGSGGIYFDPQFYYTIPENQRAALSGSGTPSATNPYLTQNGNFIHFGGTGSDGALNVTTGTTTINLGNAAVVTKNYTSINISSGATVNFSNPNANGTIIRLKSQGTVTIAGTLDASGMGAAGGASTTTSTGNAGTLGTGILETTQINASASLLPSTFGTSVGFTSPSKQIYTKSVTQVATKSIYVYTGSGGASGTCSVNSATSFGTGGAGGFGGGGIYIESVGALSFTGTINTSGLNGGTGLTSTFSGGGGGGGAAGDLVILYDSVTANSGTVISKGGNGGATSNGAAGPVNAAIGGAGAGSFNGAGGTSSSASATNGSGAAGSSNIGATSNAGGTSTGNDASFIGLNTEFF